jgi:predicted nucleotidyltransferase
MVQAGGVTLRVSTPEDLIIMKAVAHRPRDAVDIETIISVTETLDVARIRDWVRQFADALETPEILSDLNRLLGPPS